MQNNPIHERKRKKTTQRKKIAEIGLLYVCIYKYTYIFFSAFLLEEEEEEMKQLSCLIVQYLTFFSTWSCLLRQAERIFFSTIQTPAASFKIPGWFLSRAQRVLPSLAAKLAGEHHAFQDLEVNPGRDRLNAIQKLQDVLVFFVFLMRAAREKAKFPKLWVEHGTA